MDTPKCPHHRCKTYKLGIKLFRERLWEPKRKGACENPKRYSGIERMNFKKYFKPAISCLSCNNRKHQWHFVSFSHFNLKMLKFQRQTLNYP